ncbi:MAG: hypothetical protein AABY22_04270 [Nanoarchaeota archaeon]
MFKIGENYILARKLTSDLDPAEVVLCTEVGPYQSSFYSMKNNVKFVAYRHDYGHIHEIISNEQFKGKTFALGDVSYSYKFYEKIVSFAAGELKPYPTKETTWFLSDKSSKQTTTSKKARGYRIKRIDENEFWKMYYQE